MEWKDNLQFIITGVPHSGTTPLLDMFNMVDGYSAGFECGFLLADNPLDFLNSNDDAIRNIYYPHTKDYGVDDDDLSKICDSDNFIEMYGKLKKMSKFDGEIFDKAPHYALEIDNIIEKTNGEVPIIFIYKDIRSQYWSYKKRGNPGSKFMNLYTDDMATKLSSLNVEGKIFLIKYEDFCNRTNRVNEMFEYLGIKYDDKYLSFISKEQPQYGSGLQTKYINSYVDNLTESDYNLLLNKYSKNSIFYTN